MKKKKRIKNNINRNNIISIDKNHPDYLKYITQFMRTDEGKKLLYTVMDQLIDGFTVTKSTDRVHDVIIDTSGIVIDFDELNDTGK